MLNRVAAFTLLALLFFSVAGNYLLFKTEQYGVRAAVNVKLEGKSGSENIQSVLITPGEEEHFTWMRTGKEFRYKGCLYDVVKVEKRSNGVVYYCLCDNDENALIEKLVHELQRNASENKEPLGKIALNLLALFGNTFCETPHTYCLGFSAKLSGYYSFYSCYYLQGFSRRLILPPDFSPTSSFQSA